MKPEDQNWNGPAANFIVREGKDAGSLDVISANKNEDRVHLRKRNK
jgi:hypothetical protein